MNPELFLHDWLSWLIGTALGVVYLVAVFWSERVRKTNDLFDEVGSASVPSASDDQLVQAFLSKRADVDSDPYPPTPEVK